MFAAALLPIDTVQSSQQNITEALQQLDIKTVFAHKKNENLYWQSLIQVASGDKEAALNTVEMLKADTPTIATFTW